MHRIRVFLDDKEEHSNGQTQDYPDSQGKDIQPSNQYPNNHIQAEMMSNIAYSINNLMDDSEKGRKTNIERALEERVCKNKLIMILT